MKKLISALALFLCVLFLASCGETALKTTVSPAAEPASFAEDVRKTEENCEPAEDGVLRVLLIGNSFCYNYCDELYELLKAKGIRAEIGNVYYSGCHLSQHWEWYDSTPNYRFILHSVNGRKQENDKNMRYCLQARNWDVISFQEHFSPAVASSYENALKTAESPLRSLLNVIGKKCPKAKFVWNETWAYQIGYSYPEKNMHIANLEEQTNQYRVIHDVTNTLCEEFSLPMVPLGEAWQIARQNSEIGDTLCLKKDGSTDSYHDGDAGGGQLLNALVWYEFLTGESCLENSFVPADYSLSSAKIAALKEAAHRATTDLNG